MLGQRKGWIRIVEAFTMIVLIAGILLVILNNSNTSGDNSEQVYNKEHFILRSVQLDDSLRSEIIGTTPPVNWSSFPANTKTKINAKIAQVTGIDCVAEICATNTACISEDSAIPGDKDIYSKNALIYADSGSYNPRKLKIFCWEK